MWVLRAERPAKVYFEIFFGAGMRVGFFQYSDFKRNDNSIRKWKTNNIKSAQMHTKSKALGSSSTS